MHGFPDATGRKISVTMSQEIITAHALLSIRSILLRIPERSTAILPYQWSRRFGQRLGSYADFVKQRTPNIFTYEESDDAELIVVKMTSDFMTVGYLTYQRIAAGHSSPAPNWNDFFDEDKQYCALVKIASKQTRGRFAGGARTLAKAEEVLENLCQDQPCGVSSDKCAKALGDSGIPPLPIEWFENLVCPGTNTVYLRSAATDTGVALQGSGANQIIAGELSTPPLYSVTLEKLSQVLGKSPTDLIQIVKKCPFALYEPDKVYSCTAFEKAVVGYTSPETQQAIQMAQEIATMTPLRHLIMSVEAVIKHSPLNRIPSEYVLAWCAALDIKPRLLCQCMQDQIVWSAPHSDQQVFLRTAVGKSAHQGSSQLEELPKDIVTQIRQEVEKLGSLCTVDKLSAALSWSKGSENRRKYGLLRVVLQNIPDIFFEPRFMFLRSSLKDLVVFPDDKDPVEVAKLVDAADTEYRNLAQINSTVLYYLTQGGYPSYPVSDLLNALSQYGVPHEHLGRLRHLFSPGNYVYLRKNVDDSLIQAGSIESAILFALRASSRKALDFDILFQVLRGSSRFSAAVVDTTREQIFSDSRDIATPTSTSISTICFFNPDVVILDDTASRFLELPVHDVTKPSVADFLPKQEDE